MKYFYMFIFGIILLLSPAFVNGADEYTIDKAHSRVGFSVKHMAISTVRGEFTDYNAVIFIDENDMTKSSLEGSIKVASINTRNDRRDNHLRTSDFFDAENHPELTFKSHQIRKKDDDNYVMLGTLMIRGVSKEVEIPFNLVGFITDSRGLKRVGIEARLKINRFDYGVKWDQALDNGILVVSKDVEIELNLQGIKKEDPEKTLPAGE